MNLIAEIHRGISSLEVVACQAKRKKVTRKIQKTALIYPIYGNQSGFSYVI